MKKILSMLLVSSLLTTCNANTNENELNRFNRWKKNTTNFLKEQKEKTTNFVTKNKKTAVVIGVAALAIPTGSIYVSYKIKNQPVTKNPATNSKQENDSTKNQTAKNELAQKIIKEAINNALDNQEKKIEEEASTDLEIIENESSDIEPLSSDTEVLDLDSEDDIDVELPLRELNLSKRIYNLLINSGITTVEQLDEASTKKLNDIRGIGPKSLESIDKALDFLYEQIQN